MPRNIPRFEWTADGPIAVHRDVSGMGRIVLDEDVERLLSTFSIPEPVVRPAGTLYEWVTGMDGDQLSRLDGEAEADTPNAVVCFDSYYQSTGGYGNHVRPHYRDACDHPYPASGENVALFEEWLTSWTQELRRRNQQARAVERENLRVQRDQRFDFYLRNAAHAEVLGMPGTGDFFRMVTSFGDDGEVAPYMSYGLRRLEGQVVVVTYAAQEYAEHSDGRGTYHPLINVALASNPDGTNFNIPAVLLASRVAHRTPLWPSNLGRRELSSRQFSNTVNVALNDDHDDDDDDPNMSDPDRCTCSLCAPSRLRDPWDTLSEPALIQSYSYKPEPVFRGDGPVFLGAELEIESNIDTTVLARRVLADWGSDRVYLKQDGSISNGFEVVTHPMTYDFFINEMNLDAMSDWSRLGGSPESNCGLHVHVSRDGFSNPVHQFNWMKLFYRNQAIVEQVARRRNSNYARFSPPDAQHARWMKFYAKGGIGGERYQAINAGNADTFEVRVFASTLNPKKFRAALGLVDATVEYTRQLKTATVLADKGWSGTRFVDYVSSFDKYRDLSGMLISARG